MLDMSKCFSSFPPKGRNNIETGVFVAKSKYISVILRNTVVVNAKYFQSIIIIKVLRANRKKDT